VPRGQRDGSLRPYSRFSRQEPLLLNKLPSEIKQIVVTETIIIIIAVVVVSIIIIIVVVVENDMLKVMFEPNKEVTVSWRKVTY
jgi:hypothetical protein